MDELPECVACGACCFSTAPDYLRVSGEDYDRLGDAAERLTQFIGNRAFMRLTDGRCAALVVDTGQGHFVCTVYERRPRICRELERGGPACAGERDRKGNRPLRLLERLRSAGSRLGPD